MAFDINKGLRVMESDLHGTVPAVHKELADQTASTARTDAGFDLSAARALVYVKSTTGAPTAVMLSIEVADTSAGANATVIATELVSAAPGSVELKGPVPRTGKRFWRIVLGFIGGTAPTATYDVVFDAV